MLDAVGVHGISQQQGGRSQLCDAWQRALEDGIEAARGRKAVEPALTFDLGYYGNLFLPDWPDDMKGGDPDEDLEALAEDLSDEEVEWFEEVAAELPIDDTVPPKAGLRRVPVPVQRLAGWLDSSFGAASPVLVFGDLRQVRRYQKDDALAEKVRNRVREAVGDGCSVLVGHSLGSVVAYEVVALQDVPTPALLLTLGSPLALPTVRKRLRVARPPQEVQWVNVRDPRDAVSCAGGLSAHWDGVQDREVDNAGEPHSVTRYLGKWQTGSAVADALGR